MANKVQWTADQQNAIDARGGTLIVSAAAGSGKTAVLVERCIQRLLDTEHPCSADRLLIVTFTRAATAEMRSRLAEAVSKKLQEDPTNEHLQKQQMLLPSAQICTIDSFCGNLVRENFERLELSPDFRMLDQTEVNVLQQAALEEILEALYAEQDPDFLKLVELLATGRDDASIEENILRLHTYSRAYPSPTHWLNNALELYDDPSRAYRILQSSLMEFIQSYILRWENAIRLLEEERQPEEINFDVTVLCIQSYIADLEHLYELLEKEEYDEFLTAAGAMEIPTLKKPKIPKELKNAFASPALELAKEVKKNFTPGKFSEALTKFTLSPEEDVAIDNALLKPLAEKLVEIVLRFDAAYTERKRAENALDFADTELFALQLLVEDPAATPFTRTELAESLRGQFEEVLIDEYQDTNQLQDTIFAALSKNNLFMVGDVKQSIYRFRQAMPELFLKKKEEYPLYDPATDEYPSTVILGKNFRSRKGVLSNVNYTFSRLMSKDVGEITYDASEQLYFGAESKYSDRDEPDVEFHIVTPEAGSNKKQAEAVHIAKYIAKTITESQKTENPLTYRDFAILLRSTKDTSNIYRKALSEAGIPVFAEQGGGFLETPEVMTILSFLSIIDNPIQDVPLLAVLLSPLFGFTEDEVASLRIGSRYTNLYKAILAAEERGDAHCIDFLNTLRAYRTLSVSMGAGDLLRQIYEDTSYDSIAGAMSLGEQRVANLQLLLQYADSYDGNSSYGVSGFVRYMNRLSEQDQSLQSAATLSPNANVVQIMSIHKSKGLEFRVCIVADLNHRFNDMELNRRLILHPEFGIGLQGRQPDTGFTYPTLCHSAIREASLRSERSEALRVLYVAMTRAKETLVMTAYDAPSKGSQRDSLASSIQSAGAKLYGNDVVPPVEVLRSGSFYQWMLLALLQHPDAQLLRARAGDGAVSLLPLVGASDSSSVLFEIDGGATEEDLLEATDESETTIETDSELVADLQERMTWSYPHAALASSLSKRSASHLAEKPFSTDFFAESRPESLSKLGMTPAERGTCLHKFMQYADFALAEQNAEEEKQRLVNRGFLLPDEAAVIDSAAVNAFFQSSIAERMKKSPRILREHKFAILLPAGMFDSDLPKEDAAEEVLIQGIIDCAFEEDGAMVLLDYKTDRVKNGDELAERYRDQLDIYKIALEETLGHSVKEVALYSFHLGQTVIL